MTDETEAVRAMRARPVGEVLALAAGGDREALTVAKEFAGQMADVERQRIEGEARTAATRTWLEGEVAKHGDRRAARRAAKLERAKHDAR